ncbi:S8 family serine peptidase [Kitasatospora aburaviensis]
MDVAAPGGDGATGVYSTLPGGKYGSKSGTSMASPHVTGVAALIASANPTFTPADIRAKLAAQANDLACPSDSRCTGTTANNGFFGEGQVDALKAVGGSVPRPASTSRTSPTWRSPTTPPWRARSPSPA